MENPWGAHGPGCVYDGEEGFDKWDFREFEQLDDRVYDLAPPVGRVVEYYLPPPETGKTRIRISVVPKDFRKHRIICIEQKELMFAQQGLMKTLFERVHRLLLTHPSINFEDQGLSQKLSRDYKFATIDLKDASDRVSKRLCRLLLPKEAWVLLTRYRATRLEIRSGELIPYETMFTMGNALCFPIETLIFWSLSLAAMLVADEKRSGTRLVTDQFFSAMRNGDGETATPCKWSPDHPMRAWHRRYRLTVFGDDIVIPDRFYSDVVGVLESCNFVINREKTCHANSPIRESCGAYWTWGYDTRIVRFKYFQMIEDRAWIAILEQVQELAASGLLTTANNLAYLLAERRPVALALCGFPPQAAKCDGLKWSPPHKDGTDYQRLEVRIPRLVTVASARLTGRLGYYAWWTSQSLLALSALRTQCTKTEWVPLPD